MVGRQGRHADTFAELLHAWEGEDVLIARLLTTDYVGHMLHLSTGDRTGPMYPGWIERFRLENPGATFSVLDQSLAGDTFGPASKHVALTVPSRTART